MTQRSTDIVGYPPFDAPKAVANDIWIVDGAPLSPSGIILPVRMTIVRLSSGELWLHSPVRFSDTLLTHLSGLGPVRYLVAPNVGHWTFVEEWQHRLPDALLWAAPKLGARRQVRKSGLRIDRELARDAEPWNDEIDSVVVPGIGGFREVAFLHRASRTLILTDLLQSLEPDRVPARTRIYARAVGTLAPRCNIPAYLSAALRLNGRPSRQALAKLIDWRPERVIFAHGRWTDSGGASMLETAFGSLVRS